MEVVAKKQKSNWFAEVAEKTKNFGKTLFSSKARKIALMTGLLALLVVTGYLNFTLNQNAVNTNAGTKAETNMFVSLKASRTDARLAKQLLLQDIMDSAGSSAEAKAKAEKELQALADAIAFETEVETMIGAQCGYQDVIISRNDNKLNLIIKTDEKELSTENTQKIMKILATVMGKDRLEPENGDALYISLM